MKTNVVIGTRKSALALWQSEFVKSEIERLHPRVTVSLKHIVTRGDRTQDSNAPIPLIGGKGLFTAELEEALEAGEVDLAVHSLKDLPTTMPTGFVIGAIPERAAPEDVLISRSGSGLRDLPAGSVIGTSSLRRASQVLRMRPDLRTEMIRGNVDTRIRKVRAFDGPYDATLLARAGVSRLELDLEVAEIVPLESILPAPGQGALGLECRAGDEAMLALLSSLHHKPSAAAVTAERSFLHCLGAGCNTPVAAFCEIVGADSSQVIRFRGRCLTPDGRSSIEVFGDAPIDDAVGLGERMAGRALAEGVGAFMQRCE